METDLGVTQSAFQGTPISTCLPVVGTSSACQWAEGRGNFVKLSRAANGDIVKGDVVKNARTDPFIQTDLSSATRFRCRKSTAPVVRSQHSSTCSTSGPRSAVYEFMIPAGLVTPLARLAFPRRSAASIGAR